MIEEFWYWVSGYDVTLWGLYDATLKQFLLSLQKDSF